MLSTVLALALLLQLPAQDPAAQLTQNDPAQLSEVVVVGGIREELAREFINQVAAPPRGATVARWNDEICVGVVNLRTETARYLIDRVSAFALEVGLEPEEPGCDPDVVIVATINGEAVARGLVERHRSVLAPGNSIQSRSRRDLEAFAEGQGPVRWWHMSTAVDPRTGRNVVRDPRYDSTDPSIENILASGATFASSGSLITSSTRQHLRRAVIIIDFDRLGDVDFDQLADYVAFVALAQVDPEGDTSGFPSILNVFDDPAATPRLTDWDRAYLQGLYRSDDSARGSSAREGALRREMLRVREDQGAEAPAD